MLGLSIILDRNGHFVEILDGVERKRTIMTKKQMDIFKDGLNLQSGKKGNAGAPFVYLETPVYMENGYQLVGRIIKVKAK